MVAVTSELEMRRDPRRWWALGALVACLLVLGFDLTILNVALPTIAGELGATTGEQQWTADAYVVVLAALMLPAGLLGDRFGRRRALIAGLVLFLLGSVAGALADDVATVVAARAAMGVGAALVMPLSLSVLPSLFAPDERTKAIAAVSAASALGLPLGPIVGGWLLDHFWWGSVFLINIPMALIGIIACLLLLPETRDPHAPRVDPVSAALTVTGLGTLVYAVIEAPHRGWADPATLGSLLGGTALITALVLRERKAARPMLDLTLLARRDFLLNTLTATLVMFVLSGLMFVLPPYLQTVLGNDALGTGVRMLPLMGGLLVAAKASAPVVARYGPRAVIGGGLVVLSFAALLGSRTEAGSAYGFVALWMSLAGLGFGFAVVPAMDTALGTLPPERAGSGSGLLMTVRQMGSALGIALLGSLLAGRYADRLATGALAAGDADTARESVVAAHLVAERLGEPGLASAADTAYVQGMGVILVVCAVAALLTALAALALLPARPEPGGSLPGGPADPPDGRQ
ncbi:DHA2 family efflux MFS transporter permease subunit [Streptomyces uncialis]|uniref:DHA2 family efflux MFS transporter permease subunit n=1 Tax=Streptomyces uncialis TaxID=1048205 RepID=UPI00224D22E9|nr:DHA2 family efflux MFS transporter permease subunit [Streptomyces uncialis]MCX4660422.1 DHA2 family efflux MFS transporter permease subunit [Streptomyces uncialis]